MTFIYKLLYHINDTGHFLRYSGMNSSSFYIKTIGVSESFFNKSFGNLFHCRIFFISFFNYFIVNVCKVLYVRYFISLMLHISAHGVENNIRTCVSNMNIVIYRRTAYIHFYFSGFHRYKLFFLSCKSIVNIHNIFSFTVFL